MPQFKRVDPSKERGTVPREFWPDAAARKLGPGQSIQITTFFLRVGFVIGAIKDGKESTQALKELVDALEMIEQSITANFGRLTWTGQQLIFDARYRGPPPTLADEDEDLGEMHVLTTSITATELSLTGEGALVMADPALAAWLKGAANALLRRCQRMGHRSFREDEPWETTDPQAGPVRLAPTRRRIGNGEALKLPPPRRYEEPD
jgi:hypothetical protein